MQQKEINRLGLAYPFANERSLQGKSLHGKDASTDRYAVDWSVVNMEMTIRLGRNAGPEAVEMITESLTPDHKYILYLVYACRKGESVPEEVLRLMYAVLHTSSKFSVEELSTVKLLEPGPSNLTRETMFPSCQAWSLRSVVRDYMDSDLAAGNLDEIRSLRDTLLGDKEIEPEQSERDYETEPVESEKTRVATVLCALYFDKTHTEKVVRNGAILASLLLDSNDSIIDGRRKAIGPIIWLLDQPVLDGVGWTESKISSARQVFLTYICDGKLDGANISALLNLVSYPSAPLATLTAIDGLLRIEETPTVQEEHVRTILKDLVKLLNSEEGVDISIQKGASETLFSMSFVLWKAENEIAAVVFATTPGVLAVLVRLIQDSFADNASTQSYELADNAAKTLCNLSSYYGKDSVKFQILKQVGAIESLVRALSQDNKPKLQTNAAITLRNLALGGETIKHQILSRDGALAGLVSSLSNDRNQYLQEFAAAALGNLARGGQYQKLQILKEDGALATIVSCLSKNDNPNLQKNAARALSNLAHRGESNLKILNKNVGALAGLVRSLSKDNPELQKHAAAAIAKLACEGEPTELEPVSEDGESANRFRSLSQNENPDLPHTFAAAASTSVPGRGESKLQIVNEAEALTGLVRLLSKVDDNHKLQRNAVVALANLAAGEDSIKLQILEENGALAGLVSSLSKSDDPRLQKYAAWAMSTLARGGEPIKQIFLQDDGALAGLVSSLSQRDNPDLRRYAAGALKFLSEVEEIWMRVRMSYVDLLLTSLRMCVSQRKDAVLRKDAQEALKNLEK